MLSIAALNAPKARAAPVSVPRAGGSGGSGGGGRVAGEETLEAAEARCVASFESALALVQAEPERAKVRRLKRRASSCLSRMERRGRERQGEKRASRF